VRAEFDGVDEKENDGEYESEPDASQVGVESPPSPVRGPGPEGPRRASLDRARAMARTDPSPGATAPTAQPADEALFQRFLDGDPAAFETLAARYRDRAYWVAFHMVRDADEALDLAQEAFARTLTAARAFDVRMKFSTWFFRILSNLCIDVLRKRKTRQVVSCEEPEEVPDAGRGPADEAGARELERRVAGILAVLPPQHRAVLVLRDLQGLPTPEIAKILRCTHVTPRWRLHRARIKFREEWERQYGPWE
jgi:RNA polymerase sigma-70 factor (ECF subfamily)